MHIKLTNRSAATAALALAWLLTGCSNEPAAPRAGTRASFWNAARQAHKSGDYNKVVDNLEHVLRTDSEFTAQAQPWLIVLSSGMATGYMDLADSFETGARANKYNPGNLRKQVSVARASASQGALSFADTFRKFLNTNKDKEVVLIFDYPTGTTAQPLQLKRVMSGESLGDAEFESARKASVQRGVLLAACRAVGAGNDSAKTLALFQRGEVKVPREVFIRGMAESLQEQAGLFSSIKLDQPERYKLLALLALDALKAVPADKSTKELEKKIQDGLKKIKS